MKSRFDKKIYWLLDCSGSMYGERINHTEEMVRTVIRSTLNDDETTCHTIIDFSNDAYVNQPIYSKKILERFKFPAIGGLTALDKALGCLYEQLVSSQDNSDVYVILITDGMPTAPIDLESSRLWLVDTYCKAQKCTITIDNGPDETLLNSVFGENNIKCGISEVSDYYKITKVLLNWITGSTPLEVSSGMDVSTFEWANDIVEAYSGNNPYVFVSYAHADKDSVLPIISHMIHSGYRIWYDDGIDPGSEWDDNIARHVQDCSLFIAFVSKNYLDSDNCKDELNYARDLKKERLLVYLEDVELPAGMAMRLNRLQALYWNSYKDKRVFYDKLFLANPFELCRKGSHEKRPKPSSSISTNESEIGFDSNSVIACIDEPKKWLQEISDTAVALGIDIESNQLISVDLCHTRSIAIYGKKKFGKSNLLSLIVEGAKQIPDVRFVCLDDGRNELVQNDSISNLVRTVPNSVEILYTEQDFIDYLEAKGYYKCDQSLDSPYHSIADNNMDDASLLVKEDKSPLNTSFTVFIIQSRLFYEHFNLRKTSFMQKIAPYIIDESYGNKLFVFSDVQHMMDIEMRSIFNHFIDHAFLLDDITRFVSGKGDRSIFGHLDIKELKDKYGTNTTKLGEGFYYDVEADEVIKVRFYKHTTLQLFE